MFEHLTDSDKKQIDSLSLRELVSEYGYLGLVQQEYNIKNVSSDKAIKAHMLYTYYCYEKLMAKEPIDWRDPQFMEKLNAHINETGLNPFTGKPATESEKWLAKNYVLIKSSINTVQFVSTLSSTYIGYQSYYSKPIYGLHTDFLGKPKVYNRIELSKLNNTKNFTEKSIKHIFEGEINPNTKKAVGYHYDGIKGTIGDEIPDTKHNINPETRVYDAHIKVEGTLKTSNDAVSTMFPRDYSPQEVIDSINEAYSNREFIRGNTYQGISKSGIKITMYLDKDGKIISAFPDNP